MENKEWVCENCGCKTFEWAADIVSHLDMTEAKTPAEVMEIVKKMTIRGGDVVNLVNLLRICENCSVCEEYWDELEQTRNIMEGDVK